MIPFMDFTPTYNPGRLFELYMEFVPDAGTMEGRDGGFLFPKPKTQSLAFNIHDKEEKILYQPNQKGEYFWIIYSLI